VALKFKSSFLVFLSIVSIVVFALPSRVAADATPDFRSFIESATNGNPEELRGVYVPNTMALRVVEQPENDPAYVSPMVNTATRFQLTEKNRNIGLLAHNYLSGALFNSLNLGSEIYLVYGDGSVKKYVVAQVLKYQAYEPQNPNSRFKNLETGNEFSSAEVFDQVYGPSDRLILQTCIASDGDLSWGRLFVVAYPRELRLNNFISRIK
jgi:hypothetical protein